MYRVLMVGEYAGLDTWVWSLLFWLGQAGILLAFSGCVIVRMAAEPLAHSRIGNPPITEASNMLLAEDVSVTKSTVENQMHCFGVYFFADVNNRWSAVNCLVKVIAFFLRRIR